MAVLEFCFDLVSPYSYLAETRLEALAERTGATVVYRPVLLGGILKATGNHAPVETPAKFRYVQEDLRRWAERLQVTFTSPARFPISTVTAMRCALVAEREHKLEAFTRAAFRAFFVEGRNLEDPEVLSAIGNDVGLDGTTLLARAAEMKGELVARTQAAVDRGAFGAPTFFVDGQMFVGNDRLDFVETALLAGSPRA